MAGISSDRMLTEWRRNLRLRRALATRAAAAKSSATALFRAGHTAESDRLLSEAESFLRERARMEVD
ncbi:MAG: hypothetical protein K1Y01_21245 [Vicinamibacteria bacterium]|nr:hypothetical protein [Vicinamibacteria bacterium]